MVSVALACPHLFDFFVFFLTEAGLQGKLSCAYKCLVPGVLYAQFGVPPNMDLLQYAANQILSPRTLIWME